MILGASLGVHTPVVSVIPSADFRYLNRNESLIIALEHLSPETINFSMECDEYVSYTIFN